jgi:hypothetical protein
MKKIISIVLIIAMLLGSTPYAVFANEAVSAGEAQSAQEAQTSQPESNDSSNTEAEAAQEAEREDVDPVEQPSERRERQQQQTQNTQAAPQTGLTGTVNNGNVGDTLVQTGDANNTGNILNNTNSNLLGTGTGANAGSSVGVVNNQNAANSDNNGSASVVNNNDNNQNNSANIVNNANQTSITGQNSASMNVGDSSVKSGDANVTGTVITAANTNVAGVAVSEFNIVDDHNGDYVLDFNANCISGCGTGSTTVANNQNAANSTNNAGATTVNNNNTTQNNDGTVVNDVNFLADSGHNQVSMNTGGDNNITTGDANVAANLLTFLNNNIAGNVAYGVVNIFGDLVGDIIMPDSVFDSLTCSTCGGNTNVINNQNGANSDNNAYLTDVTNNNVFQNNDANIQNNLTFDAQTGGNTANMNNQGDVNVQTGKTTVDASVVNIANMNLLGGNMWLVFVNEAGNWIGKLFGANGDSNMAGSTGVEFAVDPNGQVNVINNQNAANSENNAGVNSVTNNNLNQNNTANVVNNVNLTANTGNNDASMNNGPVNIQTGDAKALANIVNFVNNNIAGGKLLVTFVNVFGNWTGDFLTPGAKKEAKNVVAQGGPESGKVEVKSENNNNSDPENTSNPVTKTANRVMAAAGFAGGTVNNSDSNISSDNNQDITAEVKVAGISNEDVLAGLTKSETAGKTTINLAWLLLATPLLAGLIIGRKVYLRRKITA